eukprot:1162019-Pelagomonas_calceolata.AAC.10
MEGLKAAAHMQVGRTCWSASVTSGWIALNLDGLPQSSSTHPCRWGMPRGKGMRLLSWKEAACKQCFLTSTVAEAACTVARGCMQAVFLTSTVPRGCMHSFKRLLACKQCFLTSTVASRGVVRGCGEGEKNAQL